MGDIVVNGEAHFFEGVEKLLEIWFAKSESSSGEGDARMASREQWESILDHVHCKILNVVESGAQVAYLLSESSLFVSKRRIILKTCGTTLCLQALPYILDLMKKHCGLDVVADCFYSRKNFMKPNQQPHPHKTFQDEIVYLDQMLSASASYCLGRMNGDCWFLYTLNHAGNMSLPAVVEPDQTLEILMTDLDQDVMSQFTLWDAEGKKKNQDVVTKESGIADLIPKSELSVCLFDPCGYSLNGLLPKGEYWTIHITPEKDFSYVSFETNLLTKDYSSLIHKVLDVFKPGKFTMTLFASKTAPVDTSEWLLKGPCLDGFARLDSQVAQLLHYSLFYTNFAKKV
ncbi:S-adenosylmethionine decarboxylase proenzyme 1-like [Clavelina lepadiformis]|uniref:S-adenosylmethionine decarboxylase proenzyme n=1 Tax=Clavelina lepadiformis TaxID=159417 RepID=A0ABP0EXC4_CLALP